MPDYALMNQCLYEGKAKEVEEMTKAALAEGKTYQEVHDNSDRDYWMRADEAKEYGLIDEVLVRPAK